MNVDLDLIGKSAGDFVSGWADGVEYIFRIMSIWRGENVESYTTDLLRLQTIAREAYKAEDRATERLIKSRQHNHELEQQLEALMNPALSNLLPPPVIREFLKRRLLLPIDVVTRKTEEAPYHVFVSPRDAETLSTWIDAMNAALMPGEIGALSTLFSAVWIADVGVKDGEIRVEFEGKIL